MAPSIYSRFGSNFSSGCSCITSHSQFGAVIRTEIKVDKTLTVANRIGTSYIRFDWIKLRLTWPREESSITSNTALAKLRYVDGASWDPYRACLPNTRSNMINDILSWTQSPGDMNILLLTGVAGSGKSTLAHTIAQHCAGKNQLITSFFFDRETSNRNNPGQLISTIAIDICRVNERAKKHITSVIEGDEGIVCAPMSRQFDQLLLQPCRVIPNQQPWVIVLDALDEGCNADLLRILCNEVGKLPPCFRFFITSRTYPELERLRQLPHVRSIGLDVHGQDNMNDIAVFIPHRLKMVAQHHELDEGWPGRDLVRAFETRAEGLFLWVATICDYLCTRYDPTEELRQLVSLSTSTPTTPASSPEAKMDELYIKILQTCDWTDDAFLQGYQRLMGAAVATKTPLTLMALGRLYQHTPFAPSLALRQLNPLLTGLGKTEHASQPVRFLHQSLRDFLTLRAKTSAGHKFGIDEKEHSQTLAYLCLRCMNTELDADIPGTGYITGKTTEIPGIPAIPTESISEELWYSCRFWIEHILDIEVPPSALVQEHLKIFLDNHLGRWAELVAACGRYEGISKLLQWLQVCTFWGSSSSHMYEC